MLLEATQLQTHAQSNRRTKKTKPKPNQFRAFFLHTCSPIMSHFRLKNASHSSVGFLAKYLQKHNGFRVYKVGDRSVHVEA